MRQIKKQCRMLHRTVGLHPSAQELSCSDDVTILFDCSARDGELAKAQNLFDHGKPEVDEEIADQFQQSLKKAIPQFKEIGAYLYIWDGLPFCDDPRNLTMHTIIAAPGCVFRSERIWHLRCGLGVQCSKRQSCGLRT